MTIENTSNSARGWIQALYWKRFVGIYFPAVLPAIILG